MRGSLSAVLLAVVVSSCGTSPVAPRGGLESGGEIGAAADGGSPSTGSSSDAGAAPAADGGTGAAPVPCSASSPCAAGAWCDYQPSGCGANGSTGVCQPRPDACTLEYAPVCGCDGVTYGNACAAHGAGTGVASAGACATQAECGPDRPCGGGEFCEYPIGACAGSGTCRPRPEACTREYRPVCGCDGVTYGNACTARAAGVSIQREGECVRGCNATHPCGPDEVCDYENNTCGQAGDDGVCRKRPTSCDVVCIQPGVCGCDGSSHCTKCDAWMAGTDVAYERPGGCAPAETQCGPDRGCGPSEFCDTPQGACGGEGVCRPRPQACPDVYAPVCGCDGATHSNACEANAAGVDVAFEGACGEDCGGIQGLVCPEGKYCDFEPNSCGYADQMGKCRDIPGACPLYFACIPVCACNGQTYCNPCEAAQARSDIAHEGACEQSGQACGGRFGLECPAGYFCDYAEDDCGATDRTGTCAKRPEACTTQYNPVCGCDGRSYSNACVAHASGTDVSSFGGCE